MARIFVSYTESDLAIAQWIAWELEAKEHSVIFQAWGDLNGNWILEMDKAMREVDCTVAVLSDAYMESIYAAPEWANAVRLDPMGEQDLLIPVRVEKLSQEPQGWLAQISYADFVDKSEEKAREVLNQRITGTRSKPQLRPSFPLERCTINADREQIVHLKPSYPPLKNSQITVVAIDNVSHANEHAVSPVYTFLACMERPVPRSVIEAIFGVEEVKRNLGSNCTSNQNCELLAADKSAPTVTSRDQALLAVNKLSSYLGRNYSPAASVLDLNIARARLYILAGDIKRAVRLFRDYLWAEYSATHDGKRFSTIFADANLSSTKNKTRSYVLNLQGLFARDQGDLETAIRRGKSALKNVDENNPLIRAIILQNLAEVQMETGAVEGALSSLDASKELLNDAKRPAGITWRSAAIRDRARISLLIGDVTGASRLLDDPLIWEQDADFALRSLVSDRVLLEVIQATTCHADGDVSMANAHIDKGIQLINDAPSADKEEEDLYRRWLLASLHTKGAEVQGTAKALDLARGAINALRQEKSTVCRPMKKYECTLLEIRVDLSTRRVEKALMQVDHQWTRLYQETLGLMALASAYEGDRSGVISVMRQIGSSPFHFVNMDLKRANEFITSSH